MIGRSEERLLEKGNNAGKLAAYKDPRPMEVGDTTDGYIKTLRTKRSYLLRERSSNTGVSDGIQEENVAKPLCVDSATQTEVLDGDEVQP